MASKGNLLGAKIWPFCDSGQFLVICSDGLPGSVNLFALTGAFSKPFFQVQTGMSHPGLHFLKTSLCWSIYNPTMAATDGRSGSNSPFAPPHRGKQPPLPRVKVVVSSKVGGAKFGNFQVFAQTPEKVCLPSTEKNRRSLLRFLRYAMRLRA